MSIIMVVELLYHCFKMFVFSVYTVMSPYDLLARKIVNELDAVVLSVE